MPPSTTATDDVDPARERPAPVRHGGIPIRVVGAPTGVPGDGSGGARFVTAGSFGPGPGVPGFREHRPLLPAPRGGGWGSRPDDARATGT
jgi:hypothetical protein